MLNEKRIRDNYRNLTLTLIKKKISITTMESATAGQIASLITDTEGASEIFRGAFVTYSNSAKIMQGVPKEVIERFTVYSRETAQAMAQSCRRAYQADIGIGVTGTMGNIDPENAAASVPGRLYFAIAATDETKSFEVELEPQPTRLFYKLAAAEAVYEELVKLI